MARAKTKEVKKVRVIFFDGRGQKTRKSINTEAWMIDDFDEDDKSGMYGMCIGFEISPNELVNVVIRKGYAEKILKKGLNINAGIKTK